MSGVTDASIPLVPLMGFAVAVLGAFALAGLWIVIRRLRGKRIGGRARMSAPGALEIAAIILLLIGGFFFLVGWVVGAVLLWLSPRWRLADKLLGTLMWPGGLFLIVYVATAPVDNEICSGSTGMPTRCISTGPSVPPWVGITTVIVLLIGQLTATVWLGWRATHWVPGHDNGEASITAAS